MYHGNPNLCTITLQLSYLSYSASMYYYHHIPCDKLGVYKNPSMRSNCLQNWTFWKMCLLRQRKKFGKMKWVNVTNPWTNRTLFYPELGKTNNYPSFCEHLFYAWIFTSQITSTTNSTWISGREAGFGNINSSDGLWPVVTCTWSLTNPQTDIDIQTTDWVHGVL